MARYNNIPPEDELTEEAFNNLIRERGNQGWGHIGNKIIIWGNNPNFNNPDSFTYLSPKFTDNAKRILRGIQLGHRIGRIPTRILGGHYGVHPFRKAYDTNTFSIQDQVPGWMDDDPSWAGSLYNLDKNQWAYDNDGNPIRFTTYEDFKKLNKLDSEEEGDYVKSFLDTFTDQFRPYVGYDEVNGKPRGEIMAQEDYHNGEYKKAYGGYNRGYRRYDDGGMMPPDQGMGGGSQVDQVLAMLSQLPPDQLQQVVQALMQMAQGGGMPQGDPSMGGMPPEQGGMPPQGMMAYGGYNRYANGGNIQRTREQRLNYAFGGLINKYRK